MSKYRRDDKTFREQIAKLADAGLKFPSAPAKLPEHPLCFDGFSKKDYPVNFNDVPAYMRTFEPQPDFVNKFNPSGLIAGLIFGSLLTLAAVALTLAIFGGVR